MTHHKNQAHLSEEQKLQLTELLKGYECILEGRPGTFKGIEVDFDVDPNIKPYYARPYPVPVSQKGIFKEAIEQRQAPRLVPQEK